LAQTLLNHIIKKIRSLMETQTQSTAYTVYSIDVKKRSKIFYKTLKT